MYNIHLLPASFGDAILVEYGTPDSPHYILIDGGPYMAFKGMYKGLKKVAPAMKEIELLVITHVDIDHIDGIITMLNRDVLPFKIKQVWFNGWDHIHAIQLEDDVLGAGQGEYVSELIRRHILNWNTDFGGKAVVVNDFSRLPEVTLDGAMKLKLLSPGREALKKLVPVWIDIIEEKHLDSANAVRDHLEDDHRYDEELPEDVEDDLLGDSEVKSWQAVIVKEDTSVANNSSIAFIGTFDGHSCLFSGDATSDSLLEAFDGMNLPDGVLRVDAWKLAHHGSKKSTVDRLMERVRSPAILVSSDGKRYKHPNDVCMAKLLKYNSD